MVTRDFEQCPNITPSDKGPDRERPQKSFIAVFVPQLTRMDICNSSYRGCEGVFYAKELTPFILDIQGPLLRDRDMPALSESGVLTAQQIIAIMVHYQLAFLSKKEVQLYRADYEKGSEEQSPRGEAARFERPQALQPSIQKKKRKS